MFRKRQTKSNRKRADQRRNVGDWKTAEILYRNHLIENPDDVAIWIQLGHVLREQKNLAQAVQQYERAFDLNEDADALLHLAHTEKLLGRYDEAAARFKLLLSLDPKAEHRRELRLLKPWIVRPEAIYVGAGAIIFSIQDLIEFLRAHPTMSGIQRVQAGIALHAITAPDIDAHFIINDNSGALKQGEFWRIAPNALKEIIDYAASEAVDHEKLREKLSDAESDADIIRPVSSSTIILLGAFWALGNSVARYLTAKRDGVRIGAYLYDIIPITHPQYCDIDVVRDFPMALAELCTFADFALTISDFTRESLKQLLLDNCLPEMPMRTVPLAHSLTAAGGRAPCRPAFIDNIGANGFAAYVSTIEGRKNHIFVVRAWQRMIANGVKVPDLVFVGRKGWRNDELFALLDQTSNLCGRIHIVHDLTDGELGSVYDGCLFTVFTSLVEGWGLPVGESLMHQRPCIASCSTSVPEVGGDFVDYVDPTDLENGIAVFTRMIVDHEYRAARQQNIAKNFVPRLWDEVGADFIAKTKALGAISPRTEIRSALLAESQVIRVDDVSWKIFPFDVYLRSPQRLFTHEAFDSPGAIGAWLRGKEGRLTFDTAFDEGEEILVFLLMVASGNQIQSAIKVCIESNGPHYEPQLIPMRIIQRDGLVRICGQVGYGGKCTINFTIVPNIDQHASIQSDAHVWPILGLKRFGFARLGNTEARQALIERFLFADSSTENP